MLAAAFPSIADTVWVKNGDRLSGQIKFLEGGKLLIQTSYAGVVTIDWKQVKTLESDKDLLVKQDTYNDAKALLFKAAADDGKVLLTGGETPKLVELENIKQVLKPKAVIGVAFKGNLDVALEYRQEEKDTLKYDIDFNATLRNGFWRHTTKGEINREFKEKVTSDNWGVEYALDRFLSERWFWQGRLFYSQDKIDDPAREIAVGTGPGYQFWDNELGAFSLRHLFARTNYWIKSGYKGNYYSTVTGGSYNRYLLGTRIEFFANGDLEVPFSGPVRYYVGGEMGFRYKVTDWGAINLKAESDLANVTDEGTFRKTRYTVGFGVIW